MTFDQLVPAAPTGATWVLEIWLVHFFVSSLTMFRMIEFYLKSNLILMTVQILYFLYCENCGATMQTAIVSSVSRRKSHLRSWQHFG